VFVLVRVCTCQGHVHTFSTTETAPNIVLFPASHPRPATQSSSGCWRGGTTVIRDRLSPFSPEPLSSSIDSNRLDSTFTFPTYRLFLTPNPPASRARQDPSFTFLLFARRPRRQYTPSAIVPCLPFVIHSLHPSFELYRDYSSHSLAPDPHLVLPRFD
jgi:hypothetical protein